MKNLHKKIGAMVLAGMVVFGGVAAGGVNSFAASNSKVSDLGQKRDDQRVEFFCNQYGKIIAKSNNKNELKKYVSRYSRRELYNKGNDVIVKKPSEISLHLHKAKYSKNKYKAIKINLHDMQYLIEIN